MYVVTVIFELHPEQLGTFMPFMQRQAQISLDLESGCQHFDVCRSQDAEDMVFLYEVYSDRAAFEQHLASDHFKQFDLAVTPMIADKTVHTWVLDGGAT